MFSKKDIDSFILSEAYKYLFNEEEDNGVDLVSLEKTIEEVNLNLKNTKVDLQNKLKELTTQKNMVSSIQGSGKKVALQKKQATIGVQIKEEEIKQVKAAVFALEQQLKDLEIQKQNILQNKKDKSENIEEEISPKIQSKIQPKLKTTPPVQNKVQPKTVISQEPTKKKDMIVRFDTKTNAPFNVKFTDRGFLVGDTRLSFEIIEKAISKEFSLTLKSGLVLTPVKMQKILKYKDRF